MRFLTAVVLASFMILFAITLSGCGHKEPIPHVMTYETCFFAGPSDRTPAEDCLPQTEAHKSQESCALTARALNSDKHEIAKTLKGDVIIRGYAMTKPAECKRAQ